MNSNGMTKAELERGLPAPPPGGVAGQIRGEIAASGAVSFARFMDLALYAPGLGYYERQDVPIGRRGDFYTSVSVGCLFGELLAFQFAQWAADRAAPSPGSALQLIEAGAHDGRLAADVLGWMRQERPQLFASLVCWIAEPSESRRREQEKTLAEFSPRVNWSPALAGVPRSGFQVLFCNELLDAFPVRRFCWDAQARDWFEWGVGWENQRFVWSRMELEASARTRPELAAFSDLCSALPDGYTIEISPAAEAWWHEAARCLGHGKLVAIDYGLSDEELFLPHRLGGTLRAYRRHRQVEDPLADPGEQDLTAHVNFSGLRRAGEAAGLRTETLVSQARFLTHLAAQAWADPSSFHSWTPRNTRQFQTLTHPDHLGRAFRVLVQSTREGG